MNQSDLEKGGVFPRLLRFSLPYLLACFLQTFYGLADLYFTGRFNTASAITAVSVGSQLMHMLTVVIVGLAMGSTVFLSRAMGSGDRQAAARSIGNTALLFSGFALVLTAVLLVSRGKLLQLLSVPPEAMKEARDYVTLCFGGVLFITAYNILSSIYRGLGDTRRPMLFVMAAGVVNIGLDWMLMVPGHMGTRGAALATLISQGFSVLLAAAWLPRAMDFPLKKGDFRPEPAILGRILRVGLPVAAQDGLIQVSFLVITGIANRRGLEISAAVGITEKVISFLFLVPSAMLSSVSALCARDLGAGNPEKSRRTLGCALGLCLASGAFFTLVCSLWAPQVLRIFAREEPEIITLGAQYLRTYVWDCIFAGFHFCFSGYFCACERSSLSFLHNIISILTLRIPLVWLAARLWPATLYPMGLGAPLGSLLSTLICLGFYRSLRKNRSIFSAPEPPAVDRT